MLSVAINVGKVPTTGVRRAAVLLGQREVPGSRHARRSLEACNATGHAGWRYGRPPEIMRFAIGLDEYLVQMPTSLRKRTMMKASLPDRGRKHRTEPVPPVSNRLVADVDPPLEQNILNLP